MSNVYNKVLPKIAVVLLTYNRMEYAKETLLSFAENVKYSGDMYLHIADDGSPDDYQQKLYEFAEQLPEQFEGMPLFEGLTMTNSGHGGYGRNYNLASQVTHELVGHETGLILPLEDDWRLARELDLDVWAGILSQDDPEVQCVRMGYLGFTDDLWGRITVRDDQKLFMFDEHSPEKHVFAGHPRLETVAFEQRVGAWPEGIGAGATEIEVCSRIESRRGVVWPLDLIQPNGDLFEHIGSIKAINP